MSYDFPDLEGVIDPFLPLPIRGKVYRVPAVSAEVGLRCQALVHRALRIKAGVNVDAEGVSALRLDDDEEREFAESMLGPVFGEMIADGVPWVYVQRAATTTFVWTTADRAKAAEVWREADSPEARRPPRDRKKQRKTAGSRTGSMSPQIPD